jgi:pimeloyl-ACP methyl ester carboxylesterase
MARGFFHDGLGRAAAWLAMAPARRIILRRRDAESLEIASEDDVRLSAWLFPAADARGTVVLGHGYRDDRRQLADLVAPLTAAGLRTLAFDFRAHGRSGGARITIGVEEARDVRSVLSFASGLGGPVSYVGFSMGAAAYLLSGMEAHAAVLDSPYDTLRRAIDVRLSRFHVPRAVGEALVHHGGQRVGSVDEVRPLDAVAHLARPTLLLFARGDSWIPVETRARFRASMSSACALEEIEGDHADHFGDAWIARVARFSRDHSTR